MPTVPIWPRIEIDQRRFQMIATRALARGRHGFRIKPESTEDDEP